MILHKEWVIGEALRPKDWALAVEYLKILEKEEWPIERLRNKSDSKRGGVVIEKNMVFEKARKWFQDEITIFWIKHYWEDKRGEKQQLPIGVVGILKTVEKSSFMQWWNWTSTIFFSIRHNLHIFWLTLPYLFLGLLAAWSYITHHCYNHCGHLPGIKAIKSSPRVNAMYKKVAFIMILRRPRLCCHPDPVTQTPAITLGLR